MKQNGLREKAHVLSSLTITACAVLLPFGTLPMLHAQQTPTAARSGAAAMPAPPPPTRLDEENEPAKPTKPGNEGIKVHGHWVLQVKNADGTLGERREFNNSLVTTYGAYKAGLTEPSGSGLLAGILAGDITVGSPAIGFVQGPPAGLASIDQSTWCEAQDLYAPMLGSGISCYAYSATNSLWNAGPSSQNLSASIGLVLVSPGLTATVTFYPAANLVLTGNYVVPSGLTSIGAVQSLYGVCVPNSGGYKNIYIGSNTLSGTSVPVGAADIAPKSCTLANMNASTTDYPIVGALTSTVLVNSQGAQSALAVNPGQVVTVTVTLSFS
jgi:hypothetical protein